MNSLPNIAKENENEFIVSATSWKEIEETTHLPSNENCVGVVEDPTGTAIQNTHNDVIETHFLTDISSNNVSSVPLSNSFNMTFCQLTDSVKNESNKPDNQDVVSGLSMNSESTDSSVNYAGLPLGTSPVIVFMNNDKGKVEANLLLQSSQVMAPDTCYLYNRIHGIYALAQANLVAQTQQDIAKQLTSITNDDVSNKQHTVIKDPEEDKVKINKVSSDKKFFKCEEEKCTASFTSELQLKNHIEYHASKSRQLVCNHEGCGRKFFWPAHLKYHRLTHENERNYQCDVKGCGKKFFTTQRLVVHSLTHTGVKPFTCAECNKGFTTAGNLKNHVRTHTGERPYECPVKDCDKKFAEFSSMKKHQLTHTGEKPFKCEECGKSYTQIGSKRLHMKKHAQQSDGVKKEDKAVRKKNKNRSSVVVLHNQEEEILHYQDLQMVFSQGVSDQVITVTTQPADTSDTHLHVSNEMLLSEDIQTSNIIHDSTEIIGRNSNANVVVLSQPPIMVPMTTSYHHGDSTVGEEITYGTEYLHTELGHEHITHISGEQQVVSENQIVAMSEKQNLQTVTESQSICDEKPLDIGPIMECDDDQR